MTTLPVREMVLYKHGVGFFVRRDQPNSRSSPPKLTRSSSPRFTYACSSALCPCWATSVPQV